MHHSLELESNVAQNKPDILLKKPKSPSSSSNLPLSMSKSRKLAKEKVPSGSRIFENYKAQIRERSEKAQVDSGNLLKVPSMTSVRRSSLNDLAKSQDLELDLDLDLGDSSGFTRRTVNRSTWSAGRSNNNKKSKLAKIGKLFGK